MSPLNECRAPRGENVGNSKSPILGQHPWGTTARTSGPLGTNRDAGDPETRGSTLGDTPGPLGQGDHADPSARPSAPASANAFSEFPPLRVVDKPNSNVSITFEGRDLSIGKARFTGAKPVSKNLSMKPSVPGRGPNPIAHANVEVHLYDDRGNEVPMSRRMVRYWAVKPNPGAKVEELDQWRIVGLDPTDFSPFAASSGEMPAQKSFEWDRPGAEDAPGLQGISVNDEPFGQLQEFLVGNEHAGGAYFQTYVLEDGERIRVINTNELKLSAREYRDALQLIDSGQYAKTMRRKLFFMARGKTSDVTEYPRPGGSANKPGKP